VKKRTTGIPKRVFIFEDDTPEVKRSKRYMNVIIALRREANHGIMAWSRTVDVPGE